MQFRNGFAHRLVQAGRFRQMMVNTVRNDLGVGFRTEGVAEVGETGAQRLMVFDDAVVDDGNAVARHVRVSILGGRNPVSGPPGMRDADVSRDGGRLESMREGIDFADRAQSSKFPLGSQYRKPGRIVPAVFQAPQTLHQNGNGIALRNDTDDSAHVFRLAPAGSFARGVVCPSPTENLAFRQHLLVDV